MSNPIRKTTKRKKEKQINQTSEAPRKLPIESADYNPKMTCSIRPFLIAMRSNSSRQPHQATSKQNPYIHPQMPPAFDLTYLMKNGYFHCPLLVSSVDTLSGTLLPSHQTSPPAVKKTHSGAKSEVYTETHNTPSYATISLLNDTRS